MSETEHGSDAEPSAKELNNDWSATSTYWGDDFVVTVETEGNESKGEVPHTNATMLTMPSALGSIDAFTADNRPESADEISAEYEASRSWATDGVTTTLTLEAPAETLEEGFEPLAKKIGDALPDDWEAVEL